MKYSTWGTQVAIERTNPEGRRWKNEGEKRETVDEGGKSTTRENKTRRTRFPQKPLKKKRKEE